MKRKILSILIMISILILSSCTRNKSDSHGYSIPWSKLYSNYNLMVDEYKTFNENYTSIYLDSFNELNPDKYIISGTCNCKNKSDNTKDGISYCPNLSDCLPGVIFYQSIESLQFEYRLYCFPKIEITNIDDVKYSKNLSISEEYIKYLTNSNIENNYWIYYDNKPLFEINGYYVENIIDEVFPKIKQNLINYYSL